MKLLLKLAVAALIANAAWRLGSEYATFYRFRDEVREAALLRALGDAQLQQRVLELAAEFNLPITTEQFTIRRVERRTYVEGSYVRPVPIFPGYEHPWRFEWAVDGYVIAPPPLRDVAPPAASPR